MHIDGAPGNIVGGTVAEARNVISGNGNVGVLVIGSGARGNLVLGNFVGAGADGASPLGNASHGLRIVEAPGNSIGGTAPGAGNTIAFNGAGLAAAAGDGVLVSGGQATGNAIRSNAVHSNEGLGIDLESPPDGVTRNDPFGDADVGANNLQNFPVVTAAASRGGSTTVRGRLDSTPNATFELDFYANAVCDPSRNGEGERFVGTAPVTTDRRGHASFELILPTSLPAGQLVTATSTDRAGNTSEFSACQVVR